MLKLYNQYVQIVTTFNNVIKILVSLFTNFRNNAKIFSITKMKSFIIFNYKRCRSDTTKLDFLFVTEWVCTMYILHINQEICETKDFLQI